MELNAQQRECVNSVDPALMIVAIPGSGKTRTLTESIVKAVRSGAVAGGEILAVTFTRLAAAEMRKRIDESLNTRGHGITIGTFHAICYEFLRSHWRELGYASEDIAVYDRIEQRKLLKEIIFTSRHNVSQASVLEALDLSSRGESIKDVNFHVAAVADLYVRALKEHNAVDYSTVPHLAIGLIKSGLRTRWRWIYVDEAQDLDSLQASLFSLLCPQRITLCGDPDQLLYSWRGASVGLMRDLQKAMNATVKVLDLNYRSGRLILEAADRLIKHNHDRIDKTMRPHLEISGQVEVIGEFEVVEHVLKHHVTEQIATTAIMGRTHDVIERHACNLQNAGVKCNLVGKREKLLERDDIKTALAYLAWPDFPLSPNLMYRVLGWEGIADVSIEGVRADAKRSGRSFFDTGMRYEQLANFYADVADAPIMERMAAVLSRMRKTRGTMTRSDEGDLVQVLTQYVRQETWERRAAGRFIAWINLRDGQDEVRMDDQVQLMTIHAAKGLEFDRVYIVGLDDRTMPHKRSHSDPAAMEEERRLMFVAMTRTRHHLILVKPSTASGALPSRFFAEAGL